MSTPLLEKAEIAPIEPPDAMATMIERFATNKDVDVEKLKALLDMQERVLNRNAIASFNAAFSEMLAEIPVIVEKAKTNNGTYAALEHINEIVRPILQRHGFALSHKTEWPDPKTVKVIGILTHRDGHERTSEFLSGADASGNKNAIQGLASAVSYGRRYTTKDLLNIATKGEDDDAERAEPRRTAAPDGYDDFVLNMEDSAEQGYAELEKSFKSAKPAYRDYLSKQDAKTLARLKAKARAVK